MSQCIIQQFVYHSHTVVVLPRLPSDAKLFATADLALERSTGLGAQGSPAVSVVDVDGAAPMVMTSG